MRKVSLNEEGVIELMGEVNRLMVWWLYRKWWRTCIGVCV